MILFFKSLNNVKRSLKAHLLIVNTEIDVVTINATFLKKIEIWRGMEPGLPGRLPVDYSS